MLKTTSLNRILERQEVCCAVCCDGRGRGRSTWLHNSPSDYTTDDNDSIDDRILHSAFTISMKAHKLLRFTQILSLETP